MVLSAFPKNKVLMMMNVQMIVEWAANWCSLCLQADLEFAHLAANLAMDQPGHFKFVRVNLDKAEVGPSLCSSFRMLPQVCSARSSFPDSSLKQQLLSKARPFVQRQQEHAVHVNLDAKR